MGADGICGDVQAFVFRHMKSVGHVEVVLLISKDPGRPWSPQEVSNELRTNPRYALNQLKQLESTGLVECSQAEEASYRILGDPEILDLCERLRVLYQQRRSSIIALIYERPLETIKSFADGFVLKKG